jgi:hypothetical protein
MSRTSVTAAGCVHTHHELTVSQDQRVSAAPLVAGLAPVSPRVEQRVDRDLEGHPPA